MSNTSKNIHVTEGELEIMNVLWEAGEATVKTVHEQLAPNRDAGYTTTLKQLQLMHEKGLVTRDESKRQHIYFPAVKQEQVQRKFMDKLMQTFFKGSAAKLVLEALGQYKTSPDELEQIQKLLDEHTKSKPTKKK